MKLAVVGSRAFNDYNLLYETITNNFNLEDGLIIISGGARGADSWAKQFAYNHRLKLIEFLPDWDKFGKAAGYKRNQRIVEACDQLIAFWDGKSKGTKHSIDLCVKAGKYCKIVRF